jgi:hypothetical protein
MYKLKIIVNGKPIPNYYDRQGNCWVEARKGTKFEIKVINEWWNRVLAIVSVDGLNVINAKHEVPENSPGYIVNRFSSVTIPGWKINENEAREFTFVEPDSTYSAKIGADPKNVGVIGIAVYEEKMNYKIWWDTISTYNTGDRASWTSDINSFENNCNTKSCSPRDSKSYSTYSCDCVPSLGVGSGEKQEFETERMYFERGQLVHLSNIYYDDREGLLRRGIIQERTMFPKSFPEVNTYCPDV